MRVAPGDDDDVRRPQVEPQVGRAAVQRVGVALRGGDEVVDELPADKFPTDDFLPATVNTAVFSPSSCSAVPPARLATVASASPDAGMSTATTVAPSRARVSAMAAPIPRAAPVGRQRATSRV